MSEKDWEIGLRKNRNVCECQAWADRWAEKSLDEEEGNDFTVAGCVGSTGHSFWEGTMYAVLGFMAKTQKCLIYSADIQGVYYSNR